MTKAMDILLVLLLIICHEYALKQIILLAFPLIGVLHIIIWTSMIWTNGFNNCDCGHDKYITNEQRMISITTVPTRTSKEFPKLLQNEKLENVAAEGKRILLNVEN